MKRMEPERRDQDFYGGLIRLHILHHASKGPVFGLWFIEELARHGYKVSPGTLYPLLHGLERKGYLRSTLGKDLAASVSGYSSGPEGSGGCARQSQRAVW
jgi:DNA-binding PadR family transcriptional regulator